MHLRCMARLLVNSFIVEALNTVDGDIPISDASVVTWDTNCCSSYANAIDMLQHDRIMCVPINARNR